MENESIDLFFCWSIYFSLIYSLLCLLMYSCVQAFMCVFGVIYLFIFTSISPEPPLSFSHDPIGSMFICDTTVDAYFKSHKPEHGEEQPRLITLADQPFLASVCSVSAIEKIEELAKIVESTSSIQGDDFLKIAARLSHAPSVVIGFLHEKESLPSAMSTSDGLKGALALIKALQALKKKITIVTQYHAQLIHDCVKANAAQGISKEGIHVVEVHESCDIKERLYPGEINYRRDAIIALQVAQNTCTDEDGSEGTKGGLVDTLFKEGVYNARFSLRGEGRK